ncbi:NADPH dehydrogenase [Trichodelitschia bisporula]|uniref:NADPH dehydrogenase n=1 Tax=Trichodelitschia bisporula TaxID=703511 RepID=A0A6G1I9M6_9PEZI|nr:NADPH dehydrogenase [Trichodelitschia bisporula]
MSTPTAIPSASKLLQPLRLGPTTLQHRIAMAPLTRFRATDAHVPNNPLMATYYAQRASVPGTLLITEATFISPQAAGYANVPGLWSQEQAEAWRPVTDAVHARGSAIFVQLWALGRTAHPAEKEKFGLDVVGASAVPMAEGAPVPRELKEEEILQLIQDYANAARNAVEIGGFDGVEIHGANGYLVDQFTQTTSNHRTDRWGGSIENRARFGTEVAKAVVAAVGADRVGIRLSPYGEFQGMRMPDPVPQFTHLINNLKELKLTYLHLVESRLSSSADAATSELLDFGVHTWGNTSTVLLAGGYEAESARQAVDEKWSDRDVVIVFGRHFIANPDLPYRIQKGLPLNRYNRKTFYTPKAAEGYTDYPFSAEWEAAREGPRL